MTNKKNTFESQTNTIIFEIQKDSNIQSEKYMEEDIFNFTNTNITDEIIYNCKKHIKVKDLISIQKEIEKQPDDIVALCAIMQDSIISKYTEAVLWLLDNHNEILYFEPFNIVDIATKAYDPEILELILSRYNGLYSLKLEDEYSIDRCLIRKEYKILQILKKYKIELPKKRILYVAKKLHIVQDITPYLF